MNKFMKRGILIGLASGFIAMLFGGLAITVVAVLGGILLGFISGSTKGGPRPTLRTVAITGAIFSAITAAGGLIFEFGLAPIAVLTTHAPEVVWIAAVLAVVLGTLSTLGMAFIQTLAVAQARLFNIIVLVGVVVVFPFVDKFAELGWAASFIFAGIYVMLGLGLDVVVGYAGLLNLGYAAFFGFGAYATALLSSNQLNGAAGGIHVNFWLLIWIAAGAAALAGILLGAPTLGLRGDYIAIITLGFGEIVPVAFQQLINITIKEPITCLLIPAIQGIGGGASTVPCITLVEKFDLTAGVRGINPVDLPVLPIISPNDSTLALVVKIAIMLLLVGALFYFFRRTQVKGKMTVWKGIGFGLTAALVLLLFIPIPHSTDGLLSPFWATVQPGQFQSDNLLPWYFLLLGIIGVIIFFKLRLKQSRLGRAWTALREDELAANQMGVNLVHTKLTAFAVGAAIAGLAGAFYAAFVSAVFPDIFGFGASIIILSAIVLGGLGSIPGNILGALIIFMADLLLLKQFQNLLNGLQTHVLMPAISDQAVRGFIQANLDPVKYRFLLLGLVLVLVMAFRPEGLLPTREQRMQFHAEEPPEEPEAEAQPSAA